MLSSIACNVVVNGGLDRPVSKGVQIQSRQVAPVPIQPDLLPIALPRRSSQYPAPQFLLQPLRSKILHSKSAFNPSLGHGPPKSSVPKPEVNLANDKSGHGSLPWRSSAPGQILRLQDSKGFEKPNASLEARAQNPQGNILESSKRGDLLKQGHKAAAPSIFIRPAWSSRSSPPSTNLMSAPSASSFSTGRTSELLQARAGPSESNHSLKRRQQSPLEQVYNHTPSTLHEQPQKESSSLHLRSGRPQSGPVSMMNSWSRRFWSDVKAGTAKRNTGQHVHTAGSPTSKQDTKIDSSNALLTTNHTAWRQLPTVKKRPSSPLIMLQSSQTSLAEHNRNAEAPSRKANVSTALIHSGQLQSRQMTMRNTSTVTTMTPAPKHQEAKLTWKLSSSNVHSRGTPEAQQMQPRSADATKVTALSHQEQSSKHTSIHKHNLSHSKDELQIPSASSEATHDTSSISSNHKPSLSSQKNPVADQLQLDLSAGASRQDMNAEGELQYAATVHLLSVCIQTIQIAILKSSICHMVCNMSWVVLDTCYTRL